jgi:hypothetical protein
LFENISNHCKNALIRKHHENGMLYLPISQVFVFKNGRKDKQNMERFLKLLERKLHNLKNDLSTCCGLELQKGHRELELGFSKLTSFNSDFINAVARKEEAPVVRLNPAPLPGLQADPAPPVLQADPAPPALQAIRKTFIPIRKSMKRRR